jgi:hypothetical protein
MVDVVVSVTVTVAWALATLVVVVTSVTVLVLLHDDVVVVPPGKLTVVVAVWVTVFAVYVIEVGLEDPIVVVK